MLHLHGPTLVWDAAKRPPHEAVKRVNRTAMRWIHICVMLRNLLHRALRRRLKFAESFPLTWAYAESRAAYSRKVSDLRLLEGAAFSLPRYCQVERVEHGTSEALNSGHGHAITYAYESEVDRLGPRCTKIMPWTGDWRKRSTRSPFCLN